MSTWRTPLHTAARRGNVAIAKLLISRGADLCVSRCARPVTLMISTFPAPLPPPVSARHARDYKMQMPIHRAAAFGRDAMIRFLLEAEKADQREDMFDRRSLHGFNILMHAVFRGFASTAELILSMGGTLEGADKVRGRRRRRKRKKEESETGREGKKVWIHLMRLAQSLFLFSPLRRAKQF